MTALMHLLEKGGPVMIAIITLSVALYARCFHLLLWLHRESRQLATVPAPQRAQMPALYRRQQAVHEAYRQQRMVLGAMIAAAPLLGLLGTVSGMITTFESLTGRVGQKSMEGLARGISEVLVATESGLVVAIPALLLVYLAHRAVQGNLRKLSQLSKAAQEGVGS